MDFYFLVFLQEYEGTCGSCIDYYQDQRKRLETIYRDWLIDSAKYKEKPKEPNNNNEKISKKKSMKAPIRSFKALEID